jgi:hypothetical protein
MEITDQLEEAIIADLIKDPAIALWNPEPHDGPNAKGGNGEFVNDDQLLLIVVSAENRGDLAGTTGAGIKLINVEIELTQNVGIEPDTTVLSNVAEKIGDRLLATHLVDFSRHLAFSTNRIKVLGILADETDRTTDIDLNRQRMVSRQFVCLQMA